jgi:hypothetical protein
MATTYKILGQSAPGTTGAVLYTVPAAGSAVVSTLIVTNTNSTAKTFRLYVKPTAGTAATTQHCLSYDTTVPANDSIIMTLGIAISGSAVLVVSGSTTDVSFNAFGSEIT